MTQKQTPDAGVLTLDILMDSFRKMEEMARQDEERRRLIAESLRAFADAPGLVVWAAIRLAYSGINPLHPREFEEATQITTEYLEAKLKAGSDTAGDRQ